MLDRSSNIFDDAAPTTVAPVALSVDDLDVQPQVPARADVDADTLVLAPLEHDGAGVPAAAAVEQPAYPAETTEHPAIPAEQARPAAALELDIDDDPHAGLFDVPLANETARRNARTRKAKPARAKASRPKRQFRRPQLARPPIAMPQTRRGRIVAAVAAAFVLFVVLTGTVALMGGGQPPSPAPKEPRPAQREAITRPVQSIPSAFARTGPSEADRLRERMRGLRADLRAERRRAERLRRSAARARSNQRKVAARRTASAAPVRPAAPTPAPAAAPVPSYRPTAPRPAPRRSSGGRGPGAEFSVEG